ncbi:hypothetical protein QI633_17940 [Nocardioides sp. QY071]|uniref:hypothetical protein n=1 Tax=Nocardioides sp. QY071 TaxID=3044187 RepID=UPI002499E513|nr:hypothetical protein [Nocardioides sp. QY071]WGY00416.1 hypothetical protein QI633_17940 [Nocardioides sp. QY071]
MSAHSLGMFLLMEGAMVTGLLLARAGCLRILPLDAMPGVLRRRIERGKRVTPVVLALALLALAIGTVLLAGA